MSERERRGGFSEQEVEARLAEAGRVLVALPWAGCFPCGFRSLWPASAPATERRRPPSSLQIDAMDQAYSWTALIRNQDERRVVLMRSLMLPPSPSGKPRYVWTWGRLRRATGLHPDTLKRRHAAGIGEIVQALRMAPAAAAGSIGSRSASRMRGAAANVADPMCREASAKLARQPPAQGAWPGMPFAFSPREYQKSRE